LIKHYLIPVKPIAWKRAGVTTAGYKPRFYDTQTHEKLAYALYLGQCHGNDPLFEGPIEVITTYYFPFPVGHRKHISHIYHYRSPDIDNLNGLLYDACKNVVFKDDCLIASELSKKLYDLKPRIEITIRNLE
jgi:Holliday junction resolvase RusA-like endonuclease